MRPIIHFKAASGTVIMRRPLFFHFPFNKKVKWNSSFLLDAVILVLELSGSHSTQPDACGSSEAECPEWTASSGQMLIQWSARHSHPAANVSHCLPLPTIVNMASFSALKLIEYQHGILIQNISFSISWGPGAEQIWTGTFFWQHNTQTGPLRIGAMSIVFNDQSFATWGQISRSHTEQKSTYKEPQRKFFSTMGHIHIHVFLFLMSFHYIVAVEQWDLSYLA